MRRLLTAMFVGLSGLFVLSLQSGPTSAAPFRAPTIETAGAAVTPVHYRRRYVTRHYYYRPYRPRFSYGFTYYVGPRYYQPYYYQPYYYRPYRHYYAPRHYGRRGFAIQFRF